MDILGNTDDKTLYYFSSIHGPEDFPETPNSVDFNQIGLTHDIQIIDFNFRKDGTLRVELDLTLKVTNE